ncbi:Protein tyrosine kinase [Musa troglodytarum]|uniref:Protein tyrosine kinase n=1 Tax=Musa troglodytarum TaxID=320322 RepID=A0A9E7H8T0_9LILI|nr:Protein tyrosine kinase [Musa troglodytarum]
MFKFLKGVVGGSGTGPKDLPYNIGEPYPAAWGSWTHHRGTSKEDGSSVSIFSLSVSSSQDGHLAAGRNGVKRLRTVRHPNILSFLHSTEAEISDGSTMKQTIYIVTEPVMPLSEKIKELNLTGTQRDEYFAWGLHQISKAVSFLNNDCKLVHGNVCLASVVVTPTLDWKLHAFDVLSEFDGNSEASNSAMLQYEWLIGSQYKPMELVKSDWGSIRKSPPWAIDSWGLGCLIYELFSGMKLSKTEELRNTSFIPKSLLPDYQRLLSSTPSRRLNPLKLIDNSEYFHNKLVETIQFMEILNLKDSVEKDSFFRKLPNLAEQLPRQIVLKKLLPLLSSALEFGSAAAPALNALLKMGSWLSTEEFNIKVLPTIVKLFASNDRAIRVALLQHIDQFGESLSSQIVDEQVFPHVANGFADTSAFLRELTLKSMLVLAPKVDEEPAIRTNTTILLGNIASYLNDAVCAEFVMLVTGIMALSATISYYDMTEISTRILPNIVVLTSDPDGDVRTKAFQAIDQFLFIAKQHHEKLITGDTNETAGAGVPSIAGNASLLGWAMSSLTLKGKASEHGSLASANATTTPDLTISNPSSGSYDTASSAVNISDQPRPSSPTSTDGGWGEADSGLLQEDHDSDKEGWDDIEPLEEQKLPSLASIQAAQQRPVVPQKSQNTSLSQPKTAATRVSKAADEDDLWGPVAVPAPRTVPHTVNVQPAAPKEADGLWGSIAVAPPKTTSRPLKTKASAALDDSDPWAAIAAPPPTTKARPLSLGRGRGTKPASARLGAQRIDRNSSGS